MPTTPPRSTERIAMIGMFAAVLGVTAQVAVPIPGLEVPFTLQTMAVALAGLLLGARDGATCLAVYLLAGAIGLPVFAGGRAGPAVLVGPTGGFLLGFVAQAGVTGWVAGTGPLPGLGRLVGACLAGLIGTYACGAAGLILLAGAPAARAAQVVLPFLPGAAVKAVLAALLYRRLAPALPGSLRRSPPRERDLDG